MAISWNQFGKYSQHLGGLIKKDNTDFVTLFMVAETSFVWTCDSYPGIPQCQIEHL
jgi:hypothetical protein